MKTCPACGRANEDKAHICSACGRALNAIPPQAASSRSRPNLLQDSSKALGLLFGILVILTVFGIAVAVRMLLTAGPASLVEILLFGLLAADALILLLAVRGVTGPGWIGYLSVWILGLIPYFGWVIVYGAGHGIADVIGTRRANAALIALLAWIAVVMLCLGAHLFVASAPAKP